MASNYRLPSDDELEWDREREQRPHNGNGHAGESHVLPSQTDFSGRTPMKTPHVIPGVAPRGCVGEFAGTGGAGKSTLALQLAVAHVLGRDWLGFVPELGPIAYLDYEDGEDIALWRLSNIAESYGVGLAEIMHSGFAYFDMTDVDNANLAEVDPRTKTLRVTPFYHELKSKLADMGLVHVFIDTKFDVYVGNEIDRGQARAFTRMLARMARAGNYSLMLMTHPSNFGEKNKGASGSTGWQGGVRYRWWMRQVDDDNNDRRRLEFVKNQYARRHEAIELEVTAKGLWKLVPKASGIEAAAQLEDAKHFYWGEFRKESRKARLHARAGARRYPPLLFARVAKSEKRKGHRYLTRELLERVHNDLVDAGRIVVATQDDGRGRQIEYLIEGHGPDDELTLGEVLSAETDPQYER